jgi:ribosomal protein L11 methyltransferase
MNYLSYNFKIVLKEESGLSFEELRDILIAELGYTGFESFIETENGTTAYIQKKDWYKSILKDVRLLQSDLFVITYDVEEIEQVNWNREWEKNFQAIQVNKLVSIRAPFHDNPMLKYDMVIEPKMSFGTGHHETTHLMIEQLIDLDLKGKNVLDMGCGTGILAIFSEMKGASMIDAIDIDPWCYENSLENVKRNLCSKIKVHTGDAGLLKGKKYDLIIANINRNILLKDISIYAENLSDNGIILLSGFYKQDIPIINNKANQNNLRLEKTLEKNNWISLKYVN